MLRQAGEDGVVGALVEFLVEVLDFLFQGVDGARRRLRFGFLPRLALGAGKGAVRPFTGHYVINVARGRHLVDDDLIALLDSGHLAGATLDVFRTEPLPAGHPFWHHPKITLTPHTSARTLRGESIAQIAGKIRLLESGTSLACVAGVVDPNQGY